MLIFLLIRMATGVITLVAVSFLMFVCVAVLPGDMCTASLGKSATAGALERCHALVSQDGTIVERYARWAVSAVQGDLGQSLLRRKSVAELIAPRLFNTLVLAAFASAIAFPLAVFLGIAAALWRDRPLDLFLSTVTLIGMTVPEFVSATLLILVFTIWLDWLPGISMLPTKPTLFQILPVIATPALALAFVSMAHVMRLVRASTIEVLESPYVHMARLRGMPEHRVIRAHVLPNAMLPAIGIIGLQLAWLLGGVVVVEVVFNYPGLGRTTMDAISDRDLTLVLGVAAVLAAIYVVVTLVADLVMFWLNPRLRTLRT